MKAYYLSFAPIIGIAKKYFIYVQVKIGAMREDNNPPIVAKLDGQMRFQIPQIYRELYNLSPGGVIEINQIRILKKSEIK
jgi:hypothetical protein